MILGMRTAIYPAADLAAAKTFYTQALGVAPYYDEAYYVGYAVGGFELGLIPDDLPSTTGVQAFWGVADIDAELERLIALGAQPYEPAKDVGGGIKVASVLDPSGNRFSVIENPAFDPRQVR